MSRPVFTFTSLSFNFFSLWLLLHLPASSYFFSFKDIIIEIEMMNLEVGLSTPITFFAGETAVE
jgi:hypothetical protein